MMFKVASFVTILNYIGTELAEMKQHGITNFVTILNYMGTEHTACILVF